MTQRIISKNKISFDKRKLNNILIIAVLIRLLTLFIIVLLRDNIPSLGFIANSELYDDYRYEQGAFLYSQKANGLFDIATFTEVFDSLGDWTGHNLSDPFDSTPLWYWICCDLVYITKSRLSIRFLNILLFTFSIKIVWKIANTVFGSKEAFISARLMSFLPYFVVFSCFSYKDVLVMLCTFTLIWYSVLAKRAVSSIKDLISAIIAATVMFFVRSGLIVVLIGLLLIYILVKRYSDKDRKKLLILLPICCVIGVIGLYKFGDTIIYKFLAYNNSDSVGELGLGRFIKITKISHTWKLPLTYIFSILQPISLFTKIDSWYAIICNINVTMIPIALGSIMYLFIGKKKDKSFFYITIIYYLISAVSSILVFRQLFSLLPIPVMYFSSIWKKYSNMRAFILLMSILFCILLIIMFLI